MKVADVSGTFGRICRAAGWGAVFVLALQSGAAGATQITRQPLDQTAVVGVRATFQVEITGTSSGCQWLRNGREIPGEVGFTLSLAEVQPADAGMYSVVIATDGGPLVSESCVLSIRPAGAFAGAVHAPEEWRNIRHSNRNLYRQALLTGAAGTITAEPGIVTRISFIDLDDDIVQVEFSGPGSLTVLLDDPSGPAMPRNYNQDVAYMRGHASLFIEGATAETYVSAFSVGRGNAVNPHLFVDDVAYDGWCNLARLVVRSDTGELGGIFMGNTAFFDIAGSTGVFAPGVIVRQSVRVHDVTAFDEAEPVLILGEMRDPTDGLRVAGGSLDQANGRPLQIMGIDRVIMAAGTDSHGRTCVQQRVQAQMVCEGRDVTGDLVLHEAFRRIAIAQRVHVYSFLETAAIGSLVDLRAYIAQRAESVDPSHYFDYLREAVRLFGDSLEATVDFSDEALVLLPHTEGSGSIGVVLGSPVLDAGTMKLALQRTVPQVLTADMAYHCFAFAVKKAEVQRVELDRGGSAITAVDVPQ